MDTRPEPLPPELILVGEDPPVDDATLQGDTDLSDVELDGFDQVEWALRRMARAQRNLDVVAARRAEMVDQIDTWFTNETYADRHTVERLTGIVQRYALARRTEHPDGPATYSFPSGSVPTRRTKEPAIVIDDEKALIAWLLKTQPDMARDVCRFDVHPRISDLRERLRIVDSPLVGGKVAVEPEGGEHVPGVHVQPPTITVGDITLSTQQEDDQ